MTLRTINGEFAKRGYKARLARANGYFYFFGGEAADWLDQTVKVATLDSLTLEEWLANFLRLKKLNEEIIGTYKKRGPAKTNLLRLTNVVRGSPAISRISNFSRENERQY